MARYPAFRLQLGGHILLYGLEASDLATAELRCDALDGRTDLLQYRITVQQPLFRWSLSLRFNHEGFCDGDKAHHKTLAIAVFTGSGALLEGRVALGPPGEPAFGPPPGRSPAGFRRFGRRAEVHQKRRNRPVDSHGRKATRVVATLPRQPKVRDTGARQPELRV